MEIFLNYANVDACLDVLNVVCQGIFVFGGRVKTFVVEAAKEITKRSYDSGISFRLKRSLELEDVARRKSVTEKLRVFG